jgi:predicted metal-dependent phosphoesterase TrpH
MGADVNATLNVIAEWYKSHGYQCLVITDHEHLTDVHPLSQQYAKDGSFLLVPGQEITQTVGNPSHTESLVLAHVNGININRQIMPVDYPKQAADISSAESYQRNAQAILAAGGIVQINHPNIQWAIKADDLAHLDKPFLLEVWNAYKASNNLGGADDSGRPGPSPEALWDTLLTRGKVVWAVASDDAHDYVHFEDRESPTPGKAWIVMQAPALSMPAILEALRNGNFYASTGVALDSYSVDEKGVSLKITPTLSAHFKTRFIGSNGALLAEVSGTSPHYAFQGNEVYVRASIIDSNDHRAWTQPVFRDGRKKESVTK